MSEVVDITTKEPIDTAATEQEVQELIALIDKVLQQLK